MLVSDTSQHVYAGTAHVDFEAITGRAQKHSRNECRDPAVHSEEALSTTAGAVLTARPAAPLPPAAKQSCAASIVCSSAVFRP